MNNYLIPANSKKGQLLFNIFRPIDLAILATGLIITIFMLFIIKSDTIVYMVLKLIPLGFSVLLVLPIPYYHNTLVFLGEIITYLMEQKRFSWKGWCAKDEFAEQQR